MTLDETVRAAAPHPRLCQLALLFDRIVVVGDDDDDDVVMTEIIFFKKCVAARRFVCKLCLNPAGGE